MATSRAEQLINEYDAISQETESFANILAGISTRLREINLNDSGATSAITVLVNETNGIVEEFNNTVLPRYDAASRTFNSLNNEEIESVLSFQQEVKGTVQLFFDISGRLNSSLAQAETTAENAERSSPNNNSTASNDDPAVAEIIRQAEVSRNQPVSSSDSQTNSTTRGIRAGKTQANQRAVKQDLTAFTQRHDWRVRLSLAPRANYLYKSDNQRDIGILLPLKNTDGVIFPYTPQISVNYAAAYNGVDVAHTNYKVFQYSSSSVDNIQVSCEFTAQDTSEAAYLLAVIHFFRSVTKMFYGQDNNPRPGTPPPLCYLHGLGEFQFNNHPLVVTTFNYQLPNDVDYIRADSAKYIVRSGGGRDGGDAGNMADPRIQLARDNVYGAYNEDMRVESSGVPVNGVNDTVNWEKANYNTSPTYVPTKMTISFSAYPIVTRYDISQNYSLREYGSGKLHQGRFRPNGTGIW